MIKPVEWLHRNLGMANVVILDASLEAKKKRVKQIPGARFFDLPGKFSDPSSDLPNTMPGVSQFQEEAKNLGINNDSCIVIYDNVGIYSAPRVWFMFKAMGHDKVYVLDGGLPQWESKSFPIEEASINSNYSVGNFNAKFSKEHFKSIQEIKQNIQSTESCLIDARSEGRFKGLEPEPRPELKSGRIQGSSNLPFTKVLNEEGRFKSKDELQKLFPDNKPLIFTCGSGLTACIILMAACIAGHENVSVYDGSWTEWAIEHELYTA